MEIEIVNDTARELTTGEGLIKVVIGAAVAFMAKKLAEDAVETGFRNFRKS